jgi:hypothetical protein
MQSANFKINFPKRSLPDITGWMIHFSFYIFHFAFFIATFEEGRPAVLRYPLCGTIWE